jgi:hypothetical protein
MLLARTPCESRMREICTSGLTRERARSGHWLISLSSRASLSTLLVTPPLVCKNLAPTTHLHVAAASPPSEPSTMRTSPLQNLPEKSAPHQASAESAIMLSLTQPPPIFVQIATAPRPLALRRQRCGRVPSGVHQLSSLNSRAPKPWRRDINSVNNLCALRVLCG